MKKLPTIEETFKANPHLNRDVIERLERAVVQARQAGIDVTPKYRLTGPLGSLAIPNGQETDYLPGASTPGRQAPGKRLSARNYSSPSLGSSPSSDHSGSSISEGSGADALA